MKKIKKIFLVMALTLLFVLLTGCSFTFNTTTKLPPTGQTSVTTTIAPTTIDPTTGAVSSTTTITAVADDTSTLNIVTINDNHGQVIEDRAYASMSQLGGLIENLEETKGDYIKICAGDLMQGSYISSITRGKIMIECLNALDFDCMVLGNHEFDWGLDTVYAYFDGDETNGEANFPLLCCNLIDKRTDERPDWIDPYTIIDYNGLKVGVIGAIGEDQETDILTEFVENYDFTDTTDAVKLMVDEIRDQVDVLIVAVHEYSEGNFTTMANFSASEKIDVFIGAHTHQFIEKTVTRQSDGYKIPLIQCDDKNENIGEIILTLENKVPVSSKYDHYYPTSYTYTSSAIDLVLQNYSRELDDGEEVIGYTSSSYSKSYLGVLAAGAIVDQFDTICGIINTGGVRDTITKGNITKNDVFSVFPFENLVYIVTMPGSTLKTFISYYGGYMYFNDGFSEESVVSTDIYQVGIIDYVYTSTYYTYLFKDLVYENSKILLRDCLIEYFKNNS